MLTEVTKEVYRNHFKEDPHPYISDGFLQLVEHKTDKLVRLVEDSGMITFGLIAGVKDNKLSSPFSAPFGGFHFVHEDVFYSEIYHFLQHLNEYALDLHLDEMSFILPPNIYHSSINAKCVNAFLRQNYTMAIPDIVNWINLKKFEGNWIRKRIQESHKSALKHNLSFSYVNEIKQMKEAYEVIVNNRTMLGNPIYLSFQDLMDVNQLFPVDFFLVKDSNGENIGAAIFYRGHEKIVQGIYWGDIIPRTVTGTMDFLVLNLFLHYKEMGFDFIDLALSSKFGIPNEGLIRFKETHQCVSSLRYTFSWKP